MLGTQPLRRTVGQNMIPPFNISSVLPPFVGQDSTDGAGRSPYEATMTDLVSRFGTTKPRLDLLDGLLRYREQLRLCGVSNAIQWINGSFVESVEIIRQRSPSDVDLLTLGSPPVDWRSRPDLFDPKLAKSTYGCDAYFIDLTIPPHQVVTAATYWYGLFSHQRDTHLWKGFLRVPLNSDDAVARALL